jgi:two-component system OmpR family response regulator
VTRLLVADDEDAILFAMKEYFETLGYHVDCAREEEEALAMISAQAYALVIADLRMSASRPTAGLSVAAAAKARSPLTRTMILTAFGSAEVEEQARRAGVDAILHKHERLKDVADVVRWLTTRES